MKRYFVFIFLLSIFSNGSTKINTTSSLEKVFQNFYDVVDQFRSETNQCETLIIFDLSKNVIKKEVFDISVKYFLNLILRYCDDFKYAIIGDNMINSCDGSGGCIIVIYECNTNECKKVIEDMDYIYFTSSYPDVLLDSDAETSFSYYRFLDHIFREVSDSPAILLTNRIVLFDLNSEVNKTLNSRGINLTTILLGHNDTNSTALLENEFQNIQNAKTMSFANYDCLSYLFYCLLPCSSDIPECLDADLYDCHAFSILTPNINPKETLHAWYVIDLLFCSDNGQKGFCHMNMTNDLMDQVLTGLRSYAHMFNISYVRAHFDANGEDIVTLENIYSSFPLEIKGAHSSENDNIVDDDRNSLNQKLSSIPWSGTLTETRIGILSIIYITNYATKALKSVRNGQSLLGNMYVYNPISFQYYTSVMPNRTNFYISHSLNQQNYIVIHPIQNGGPLPTLPPLPTEALKETSTVTRLLQSTRTESSSKGASTSTVATVQKNAETPSKNSNTIITVAGICGGIALILIVVGVSVYCFKSRQRKAIIHQMQMNKRKLSSRDQLKRATSLKDEWELMWQNLTIENLSATENLRIKKGKLFDMDQNFIHVAIKITDSISPAVKHRFFDEINLMKNISGRNNIVKMLGYITLSNPLCIVLEFCSNLDLLHYVKERKYIEDDSTELQKNTKKQFFIFAWQIAHGLEFLALKGILHRNLIAENVLIDSEKNAKISGFHLAAFQQSDVMTLSVSDKMKLSTKYMALETLKDYIFSFKTEIWTFGILLFEMFTFGEIPYVDVSNEDLYDFLKAGKRLEKPAFCSLEIYDLMLKCWMEDPTLRPSTKDIIKIYTEILKNSTEGYGYLELLQNCSNNEELLQQLTSFETD